MLVLSGRFRAILCLAFFLGTEAEVGVEKKAYPNVVVSFSPRLSPENATHLVSSLKEVLTETSSVLQEAVGLRIGSVTFHLPRTWNDVSLEGVTPTFSPNGEQQHDIHVEALSDSAFGKHPHTVQYGGCGIPGVEISVPDIFLSEDENYPKGKILAKEWLKYRYGVFDENGFPNDPMYPTHYTVPGSDDIHVTDCTFPKVEYEFRDSEENNCTLSSDTESNCFIHPKEAENTSSSLMFYHKDLPQVNHICGTDDHLHNKDSPNKQNLLCFYNSVMEIVKSSDDFSDEENNEEADENQDIAFYYVKESPVRLVLTYQNTNDLKVQGPIVLHAVRKLLHDLSLVGSKVAIYEFKNEENLREIRALSELTFENFKTISIYSEFNKPVDQPCASCAVDKAVDVLLEDSEEETGTVLVITASNPPADYSNEKLNNPKLCLIVIGFEGASEEEWNKVTGNSACSLFRKISNTEEKTIFEDLYETIESIIPKPVDDTRITTVSTDMMTEETDFVIPTDENAEKYTLWLFGRKDEDSIKCNAGDETIQLFKFENSSNQESSVFSFMPNDDDIKCRLFHSNKVLAQAQMKSKPGAYFSFRAWSFDTTEKNQTEQMPVIIYTSLSYGQYPVLDAEVKAVVTHLDGHKTEFQLKDNGLGDPDVTQNDGLYSGYFTEFDSEGVYEVEVLATSGKDQQAKIGKQGQEPCCGSIVMNEAFNASSFNLKSKTNFKAISKRPDKGYKPSRVVDLKVDKLEFPKSVSLKWTAPGGEMDRGQAYQYDFKIFCHHKDCNEAGVLPNWIILSSKPKPKEFGQEEKTTIHFSENVPENIVVHFAVKAISKGLEAGDPSNLVQVKLLQSETKEETTTPVTIDDKKQEGQQAGVIVAYVMIALACLILIAGVVYFVLERKRRRKIPEDLNTPDGFANDNKAFSFRSPNIQKEDAMERADSLPVQLYTHDQIKDVREKRKDTPKERSGMTQKSWLSLDALSGDVGNVDKRSEDSASITQIDLKKGNGEEITQLDDVSLKSVPIVVRDSNF